MASECSKIKGDIKNTLKRLTFNQLQTHRLKSLSHMMLKISDTNLNTSWSKSLIERCSVFVKSLENIYRNILDQKLSELEEDIVYSLITDLKIPAGDSRRLFTESCSELGYQYSLDELLPKFLSIWLRKTDFKVPQLSQADGIQSLSHLFTSFNIPFNNFVRSVSRRVLGLNDQHLYYTSELLNFLSLFFGSFPNYKFYVKIARVIEDSQFKNIELGSPLQYQIMLSMGNKNYTGGSNILQVGQSYTCGGLGISNSQTYRGDGLILIGKHPDADIIFPQDDRSVDYVTCILVNSQDNVYIIDVSKKSNCGIKLQNSIPYYLDQENLLNLAKNLTFYIESIAFIENTSGSNSSTSVTYINDYDETPMISEVIFSCIEGVYKENKFKVTNATRDPKILKSIHTFGCGGGDDVIDFYIPRETGVSRSHLCWLWSASEMRWQIIDKNSTNGTYFLLKNKRQFEVRETSGPKILFNQFTTGGSSTIMVGNYVFFLMIS